MTRDTTEFASVTPSPWVHRHAVPREARPEQTRDAVFLRAIRAGPARLADINALEAGATAGRGRPRALGPAAGAAVDWVASRRAIRAMAHPRLDNVKRARGASQRPRMGRVVPNRDWRAPSQLRSFWNITSAKNLYLWHTSHASWQRFRWAFSVSPPTHRFLCIFIVLEFTVRRKRLFLARGPARLVGVNRSLVTRRRPRLGRAEPKPRRSAREPQYRATRPGFMRVRWRGISPVPFLRVISRWHAAPRPRRTRARRRRRPGGWDAPILKSRPPAAALAALASARGWARRTETASAVRGSRLRMPARQSIPSPSGAVARLARGRRRRLVVGEVAPRPTRTDARRPGLFAFPPRSRAATPRPADVNALAAPAPARGWDARNRLLGLGVIAPWHAVAHVRQTRSRRREGPAARARGTETETAAATHFSFCAARASIPSPPR